MRELTIRGIILGAVVFFADFPVIGDTKIITEAGIPFMMQAWWSFCACSVCYVIVSLLTPPPAPVISMARMADLSLRMPPNRANRPDCPAMRCS